MTTEELELVKNDPTKLSEFIQRLVNSGTIKTEIGQQATQYAKNLNLNINTLTGGTVPDTNVAKDVNGNVIGSGIGESTYIQGKKPVPVDLEDFNAVTGGNPWASWKGALGGTDANGASHTGWVAPAVTGALDIGKTVMAYQNLQETKKMNEFNIEAKTEALARQAVDQKNKIAKANINRGIGMGSANAMPVQLVSRNPYSVYNTFNPSR